MIETKKVLFFTQIIGSVALFLLFRQNFRNGCRNNKTLAKPVIGRMGFAKVIDTLVPSDEQQKVSHGQVVEILVANRLTSPTPLYGVEQWAFDIGSKNLYGIAAEELNDDRLGRTLDALAPNIMVLKGAIFLSVPTPIPKVMSERTRQ